MSKKNKIDKDTWNLFAVISQFVLPRLKRFKKLTNGYPIGMTEKQWDVILDKMIFSMDFYVNDGENKLFKKYPFPLKKWDECREDNPEKPGFKTYKPNYNKEEMKLVNKNIKESKKIYKKIQEGFELFGKYFTNLWW